jgi:hypothetical protein
MFRKSFTLSRETESIVAVLINLKMQERMSFADASATVGFTVSSSAPAYIMARKIAERDYGVFIGTIIKFGFYRGSGDDMVDSLKPMSDRIRRIAKRSIARADLAIGQNLSETRFKEAMERRTRASLIYSTSRMPAPASNRDRPPPAEEAPPASPFDALKGVR